MAICASEKKLLQEASGIRVYSGKRDETVWRPFICLSVLSFNNLSRARDAYST